MLEKNQKKGNPIKRKIVIVVFSHMTTCEGLFILEYSWNYFKIKFSTISPCVFIQFVSYFWVKLSVIFSFCICLNKYIPRHTNPLFIFKSFSCVIAINIGVESI